LRDTFKTGDYTFKGISGKSNVVFDFANNRWDLVSMIAINNKTGRTLGFTNSSKFFPVGLQQWYLHEQCNYYAEDAMPITLKLTKVT